MTDIAKELERAAALLAEAGVADHLRQASLLMEYALGRNRSFIITHPDYCLSTDEQEIFLAAVSRRAEREPFQYIVGKTEFYGLDFAVSPDVLIPRPETEGLVERAIIELEPLEHPRFCEIGIGSGCIAISILKNLPQAAAVGVDISPNALEIAELNAGSLGVSRRLQLTVSDVFSAVKNEKFDAILSNPPYVPKADLGHLQAEVRDFEPNIALTDGGEGLEIIRKIICDSPGHLKQNGVLMIEIGFDQAERVLAMLDAAVWTREEVIPDLRGIPRIILARRA